MHTAFLKGFVLYGDGVACIQTTEIIHNDINKLNRFTGIFGGKLRR